MVILWNGLLGRECGRAKRIVYTFVRKRDYNPEILNFIWKVFSWSVNRMAVGAHPLLDWEDRPIPGAIGSPLAGQFSVVLTQVRGGLAILCRCFCLPPLERGGSNVLDVSCQQCKQILSVH